MQLARAIIELAVNRAHRPPGVAKRIAMKATALRNRGRKAAIKRTPFTGICTASGLKLERNQADLDELDPVRGYLGPVRRVCRKANNSGKSSCGQC